MEKPGMDGGDQPNPLAVRRDVGRHREAVERRGGPGGRDLGAGARYADPIDSCTECTASR